MYGCKRSFELGSFRGRGRQDRCEDYDSGLGSDVEYSVEIDDCAYILAVEESRRESFYAKVRKKADASACSLAQWFG